MDPYAIITNIIPEEPDEEQDIIESECEEESKLLLKDEYFKIDELYDECLSYLKEENIDAFDMNNSIEPDYESITDKQELKDDNGVTYDIETQDETTNEIETNVKSIEDISSVHKAKITDAEVKEEIFENRLKDTIYKVENELRSNESLNSAVSEPRSERLRKLSQQLPKIIITQSNTSLNVRRHDEIVLKYNFNTKPNKIKPYFERIDDKTDVKGQNTSNEKKKSAFDNNTHPRKPLHRSRPGCGDFPKRLVSKRGIENVALISNVPFEKIRLLNDTFHTLINLRWRWIVTGTIVVHFAIWLIFAIFWYITALAHYDFEPDPPKRTCVTGGYDFLTIFLASVEAQTTIGFGDRAIDEECPESIFLFIMQLILGTGLSGVLTCVVYAKLTRPEKLSRDGVGFSKKAVISMRDGRLCLMLRAWDLNYDHIISSEFTAHFVHTHRTKEGEIVRYYAQTLSLQQRQFLLWPVTLVHVIDSTSPLYRYGPEHISNSNYEITVSLKGASASMGTFTQSQTSYLPKEVLWGHRFPPVVKYDSHKQKYVIDQKKLNITEPVNTPFCSAEEVYQYPQDPPDRPQTPSSFSEKITSFQLGRSSSFRTKTTKG